MSDLKSEIKALMFDEFGLDSLADDTPIFSANVLDSMDVLRLIMALEQRFSIKISPFDVTIEMFDTVEGIADVASKGAAKS